jgi:lipopolysaccharide export system permease protein
MLLTRYLLRAHVGPFLFSFFTLMSLFLLQFVMKFIDELVGKGLTAWIIVELIALNLAWMVVLAVPMSVLVATLMAFGDLSSRNEITAMKASGMSIYRMIAPVLITGTVVALLLVLFNNRVLPEANHRAKTLTIDIRRKRPTLTIVAGLFSQDISGYSILVHKAFEKTNELEGITIYDYSNPNRNVTITAERGTISFSPDYRKLIMDLQRGEIHELDLLNRSTYRVVRFQTHRLVMDVEGFDFERSSETAFSRGDRELSAQAMLVIVDSLQRSVDTIQRDLHDRVARAMEEQLDGTGAAQAALQSPGQSPAAAALTKAQIMSAMVTNDLSRTEFIGKQIDQYMVEVHKKYAIPFACIVFVLIGVPLGITARRGGFGVAATLSLGYFVLYWACLIGGEKLADRDITSPFLGMWIANFLIGLMGIALTARIGRENIIVRWDWLQRFVPARWRTKLPDEDQAENPPL